MTGGNFTFRVNGWVLLSVGAAAAVLISSLIRQPTVAQQPAAGQPAIQEPAPPANQTYVGARECAACHFEQFMTWRETPHAKAFDQLPEKYRADATCLKCHTTGHGEPSGFTSMQATPALVGNSCEGCHGAGSEHTRVAKAFGQKKLTPQEEAQVRDTIYLMQPKNVCAECHLAVGHKQHPPYDKP
jgi:hypothetical protein